MNAKKLLFFVGLVALLLVGCEEPMQKGRAAIESGDADAAEKIFKQVLSKEPGNTEAIRMTSEVHRLRKDYKTANEILKKIWDEKKFINGAAQRSAEDKVLRELMKKQFEALHIEWAASIDPKQDPEAYEEVVRTGLGINQKSKELNEAAIQFYFSQGEREQEKGDRVKAAEHYTQVSRYQGLPDLRATAKTRADKLRREVYGEQMREHFEKKTRAELQKSGEYIEQEDVVQLVLNAKFSREMDLQNVEDVREIKELHDELKRQAIAKYVSRITSVPLDLVLESKEQAKFEVVEETVESKTSMIVLHLSINEAIRSSFEAADKAQHENTMEAKRERFQVPFPNLKKQKAEPEGSAQKSPK